MTSERPDARPDALLTDGASALRSADWKLTDKKAQEILTLDPQNVDAELLRVFAEPGLEPDEPPLDSLDFLTASSSESGEPTSFVEGRYLVRQFLGEDSRKNAFLVYDTTTGAEAVLLLIKSERNDAARRRSLRELQALAGAGAVSDMGELDGQAYAVLNTTHAA